MRSAIIVLLFVNLVFMAWGHWIDLPPEPAMNKADMPLPRLLLANEAPSRPEVNLSPIAAVIPSNDLSATQTTSDSTRCVSIGPFNDVGQQTRAGSLLHDRGFTPKERTEEREVNDGYWVYLGGLKSALDETRALKTLQDAGITDAHAVPAVDDGRRVSVGLFKERPRAERRARAVQHLGFSPDIVERRHAGTSYWIDVDLGTSDAVVPTDGFGESRIQVRACS